MRFASLAIFKKRTIRRLKQFLIIFAFLSGVLAAAESRYAIFRIYDITIEPQSILSANVLWGSLSPMEEKIWPLFWIKSQKHEEHISNYFPIKLKLTLQGWGIFRATCTPLEPVFKMYWGGKYWYVSKDRKVWLESLEENDNIIESKIEDLPILFWGGDRKLPIDLSNKTGNIMESNLPIERIEGWYDNLRTNGLLDMVKFVQARVRGDIQVVELSFDKNKTKGFSMMFSDDPKDWEKPLLAFKKIFPKIEVISEDIFVDTTYKGKILVQNKVQLNK